MKKSIAMILAVILMVSIIGTVLAECSHSWYTVSTSRKTLSVSTVAKPHGCIQMSNPHTHKKYTYELTQIYVCSKGCGATKTVVTRYSEEKH